MGGSSSVPNPTEETLAAMSALEFNDRIVSLPIFLCKKCGKFLKCPIILVPGFGNHCNGCIDDNIKTTRNEAVEGILEMLLVPCRYHNEGCIEKLSYSEISSHALTCRYRTRCCPFKLHADGCTWEDSFTNLMKHCTSSHVTFVLSAVNNVIKLELDISKNNEVLNIVSMGSYVFILLIKFDLQCLEQYFSMYYIRTSEKTEVFSFKITQSQCYGFDFLELGTSDILQDVEFKGHVDDKALVVNLHLIKKILNVNTMSIEIKIIAINDTEPVQTGILTDLECPICNDHMRPPIFQCLAGHSLCNRCKAKVDKCPTCRGKIGTTRNFALESISENMKFPCIYRSVGCPVILNHTEVETHENVCTLKSYYCPLDQTSEHCVWAGPLNTIINHLKTKHQKSVIFASYKKFSVPFSVHSNYFSMFCMVVNGEIFRVSYKYDQFTQNAYWSVQVVGPSGEQTNYRYKIGLIDGHRKLVNVDLVQDLSTVQDMFIDCVTVPFTMVSRFSSKEQLTYYYKIAKIK